MQLGNFHHDIRKLIFENSHAESKTLNKNAVLV